MNAYRNWILGTVAVLSLSAASAFAADDDSDGGRALRLSTAEGQVQVVQDGQVIADPANANLPLFEGSQIITGNDGRAEVQLEDGGVVRLSPNTTLTFTVLQQDGSNTKTDMVLNAGLAYFELQPSSSDHRIRVSYGSATVQASSFSVMRINMDAGPGSLAVFSGDVHLERSHGVKLDIHGGETVTLDANDTHKYNLSETIETDSWDSWNADRDQALNQQSASQTEADNYVNNQPAGMSDLDANGNWYNVPGQGLVWSPYVALGAGAGWDPYGYGRWVYYPRYGYIWASGYSWGYAPFQCGTWNFFDSFGWGWAPGYGCNPWYGGGWGYNIGNYPHGYRPPRRPDSGPIRIHGGPKPVGPGGPGGEGGSRRIVASIPVDRRVPGAPGNGVVTPIRGGSIQPITVGGRTLQPLRPVAPRQSYDGGSPTSVAIRGGINSDTGLRARPVGQMPTGGNPRSTYSGNPGGNGGLIQPGIRPTNPQPIYRPQPQPSSGGFGGSRPSGGGMPSRPAPSFGGGGGGGSPRPMGGGGGGMGGGVHPSGGGGGGAAPHK